jgi:hypothetical protein
MAYKYFVSYCGPHIGDIMNRDQIVKMRVTANEKRDILYKADLLNMSISDYMRVATSGLKIEITPVNFKDGNSNDIQ